jgi:hypothetical protein
MTSNLSKIKPKLRTQGNLTGNFGRPKTKAGYNSELGMTDKENIQITTQDDYLNRMYAAMDTTTDPKVKQFCYNEIKKIMIQRGVW